MQDPYSLRCQPQVMGACLDLIGNAARTLLIEANAVTDNPLIFDGRRLCQAGIFMPNRWPSPPIRWHWRLPKSAHLSERRIALLIDATLSGLPPFLVKEPGINSGFMIAHVTAAALASENKSLAHPGSVDSVCRPRPIRKITSAWPPFAARRLHDMAHNTAAILGIELLAAAQGIDFHRPLKTSTYLEHVHRQLRDKVAFYDADRFFALRISKRPSKWCWRVTLSSNCQPLFNSIYA